MTKSFVKQRVSFDSDGSAIAGVLYLPDGDTAKWPCVVMAHGFSGTMDWIVPEFADRFAEGGLAVLIFDYRCLGESEGEPRQWIDVGRQRDDLRHALEFVRSHRDIDANRIALWGTSLGGGHVVQVAAEDSRIAAVVANVPGLDLFTGLRGRHIRPDARSSPWQIVLATGSLLAAAILDAVRGAVGRAPHYIAVYGRAGRAVFSNPALAPLFRDVELNAPSWRNEVTPRFFFHAPRYRDGTIERITAPLMVTVARDDEVISTAFVVEKASRARRHEIREYPVTHFDMYHGSVRDQVAADQLAFLQYHLGSQLV
ncbi:alpha/beta hydrolase [Mycolicibacterium tusciae]|uniref:Peptidase S15 n=1 Tax=Mycolicibacterium tusciae TaxID=75922 RepID=A0A1X0JM19_9MYCO|nr:alpha/beta fold hydrolase [Mycolicibacterium tusciae]ORB63881.1 peptidase S15 [Mycolicibacterium tusciae]